MVLDHPLDGITNPKYKLLHFLTTKVFCKEKKALAFNRDRCCHLVLCLQLMLFHCMILLKSDFNVLSLCFDIFGFRFGLFLEKEGKRATRPIMFWSWNVPTFVWVEKSKSWLGDSSSNNKHSYSIKKFQQPVGISCFNGLWQGTLLKGKAQYNW
jgi:hypothetical protein